jgi:hypothetical protein
MTAWILIVSSAYQFYASSHYAVPVQISMQEFSSQLACGRAADVVRAQAAAQSAEFSMRGETSVHAVCVPKESK